MAESEYQTDINGEFILKKDGTPKKKAGRPKGSKSRGYNFHSDTKARLDTNKKLRNKKKQLAKIESRAKGYRRSIKTQNEVLAKIDNTESSTTGKITSEEDLTTLPADLDTNVIFKANEGPQTEFLAAGEKDVLYGGAAGG